MDPIEITLELFWILVSRPRSSTVHDVRLESHLCPFLLPWIGFYVSPFQPRIRPAVLLASTIFTFFPALTSSVLLCRN